MISYLSLEQLKNVFLSFCSPPSSGVYINIFCPIYRVSYKTVKEGEFMEDQEKTKASRK